MKEYCPSCGYVLWEGCEGSFRRPHPEQKLQCTCCDVVFQYKDAKK